MGGFAWVTLATNDSYSLGALVLAHSLRRVGTKYDLAVLVTPGVTGAMREKLASVFSLVQEVNVLDSKDEANLALLARPELGITFTKLHCWRLTQYEKCVFVDADTLVIRNCDELFEREELSAAPDVGWPDCFNSGVFVFKPSQQTFASITSFAAAKGSFDGGDQGLLNQYFSDWSHKDISKHLPFIYNMCSTATYSYLPAFKQFGEDVRIIHFIGITKPWLQYFDTVSGQVQPAPGSNHLQPLLQLWWNIFCDSVHPQLSPVMASSTLASVWHEMNPLPSVNSYPRIFHRDFDDFANDDIQTKVPDFSEFQDPWDHYNRQSNIPDRTVDESRDNYYPRIEQNESRDFSANRTDISTQEFASPQHTHNERFDSQIHRVNSAIHDEYKEPSVLDNRQNNERQDNSQIYRESSTEQRIHVVPIAHSQEHFNQNRHQETHFQAHIPSQTVTTNHERIYHHESQTNYNQQSEYRHNDQNNCNHDKDYRSNEEKNVQNDCSYIEDSHSSEQTDERYNWVQHDQENRQKDHSFENIHQHREDNFRDDDSHQYCRRKIDETRDDKHASIHVVTVDDTERTVITQSCVFDDKNKRQYDENRLENQDNIDRHEKSTDECANKSHSPPNPCAKSTCIATQSEPNIAGQLESNDTGIAGALAKITLGEARSPEQVAFEEHMRKQSWEQGQIDYMGRDSFENIWKKISETLGVQQQIQRQPSPPKTVGIPDKKSEIVAAPAVVTTEDAPAAKSEAAVLPELRQREERDLISELTPALEKVISHCAELASEDKTSQTVPSQPSSADAAVTTVALTPTTVPQLSPLETVETPPSQKNDNETSTLIAAAQTHTTVSTIPQTCERLPQDVQLEDPTAKTDIPETPAAATSVVEAKLLESEKDVKVDERKVASPEIVSDSPVPIQVAESVLEAEVKESVTEDLRPVTEEVISSIPVSAQESVPAVLETAMEAVGPPTSTPNGAGCLGTEIGNGIDALNLSSLSGVISPASAVVEITPEVVTSLQTQEIISVAESVPVTAPIEEKEETCPLPVREVGSVPEVAAVEQKENICALPVRQVESLPEVAAVERKEETCVLPVKTVESLPETAPIEQKQETCPLPAKAVESLPETAPTEQKQETCVLPVKTVESLPETAPIEQKQETCPLPVKPVETLQDVKLPVEQIEKSSEVKLLAESAQVTLSAIESLEKSQEIKLPAEKEQPTALPVETTEKLQEATIVSKAEAVSQSSAVSTEKPAETKAPVETQVSSLLKGETEFETKPKPVVCPMTRQTNVDEIESPIKTEELSSLPVAEPIVESKTDVTSSIEVSIEKKVPKDEAKDVEVAAEEAASQSESSEESPVRPSRTKDIQIPGTPIVTEATPPTSPPIGAVESFQDQPTKVTKKVVKKVVKKTTTGETKPAAEGADTDAEGKKVTKKVVKKVVKKTKEDDPSAPESSSGNEKPKKIVKVVKKTTKVSQNLEADTTVPETPPPGTSEIPVPPKRKLKTTAKTTPAKSDSEP